MSDLCPVTHSRYVQRIRRRYANELSLLPEGAPRRASMEQALAALTASGLELGAALRVLRQLVLERIATLDCTQAAPLSLVTLGLYVSGSLLALHQAGPRIAGHLPLLSVIAFVAAGILSLRLVVAIGRSGHL